MQNTYLFDRNTTFTVNDAGSSATNLDASIEVDADFTTQPGQGLDSMRFIFTFKAVADNAGTRSGCLLAFNRQLADRGTLGKAASWSLVSLRSKANGNGVNVDVTTAVGDSPSAASWPSASQGWGYVCNDATVLQADDGTTALIFDGLELQPFNVQTSMIQPRPGLPFDACSAASGTSKGPKGTVVKAVVISLAVVAVLAVALFVYIRKRRTAYERITG